MEAGERKRGQGREDDTRPKGMSVNGNFGT